MYWFAPSPPGAHVQKAGCAHGETFVQLPVRNLAVSVYNLIPAADEQLGLFSSPTNAISDAMDKINDRWGEFMITPALMLGMDGIILDRISFGE